MTRLFIGTALAACALLGATGCANRGPFRSVNKQSVCFPNSGGTDPIPTSSGPQGLASSLDCGTASFAVGFVEFTAAGTLVDRAQADKALALIRDRKKGGPNGKIITLIYVHGWKNNAARVEPGGKPKDVEKFKTALLELGIRAKRAADFANESETDPEKKKHPLQPVPVVGVYIGWPGKSLMGPGWFTFLSYWSRRGVANKVGDGDKLAPLLEEVIAETRKDSPNSRVILVGHSFGARVLEHAVENQHVRLYDEKAAGPTDPNVDLVLYVNSANDARLSASRLVELQKAPATLRHPDFDPVECAKPTAARSARCRDYPLLVAISSRGDQPTKRVQPIANFFSDGSPKPKFAFADSYADHPPSDGAIGRAAAAHMPFLQSHVVAPMTCPAVPNKRPMSDDGVIQTAIDKAVRKAVDEALGSSKTPEQKAEADKAAKAAAEEAERKADDDKRLAELAARPQCDEKDAACRFAFKTRGASAVCFKVDERIATNGKPPFNKTAFWIMDVDPAVIADHGDIWNLSFVEMLGQLMAPRNFFEPAAPPLKLQRTAPAQTSAPASEPAVSLGGQR